MNKTAILGYGVYIPKYRIKLSEVALTWGKNPLEIEKSLGLKEKSVAALDEDAVTLGFEAATIAIKTSGIAPTKIEACMVGSESHPYAVNPTSTIVAEFLGMDHEYLAVDLEFACKAATSGVIAVSGLIDSGKIQAGLVIGTDKAQAKPHDILEYTAASAAAALVLGTSSKKSVADILASYSYSSDTPDLWRRDGVRFPSHGGRFTEEPGYFTHVEGAALGIMKKTGFKPSDFKYCVFHMPNGKFPREAADRLGFEIDQLMPSLTVDRIGNPYTASSLIGLCAVLDNAKPGEKIFMVSYGSGAGSDAFVIEVGVGISVFQKNATKVVNAFSDVEYISYTDSLRKGGKI
jgi:hydroxymethylglutaryl-CoA synthase